MSLKVYQAKRKFAKTPEPRGLVHPSANQRRFVIQKHDATALHYDLRLEHGGVMLSWAVPKGPSENPTERHLAAATEDHPLEYRHFEGIIPEGYGAGTVMVWDHGTFDWVNRATDHLSFILHGQKLHGEYALVRLPRAGARSWLLLKKRDQYANSKASILKREPNSVITGRSLEEIEKGAHAAAVALKNIPGVVRAKMPDKLAVQKPTLITQPFNDPEWIFEPKWDGFRGIAYIHRNKNQRDNKMQLRSRNQLDLLRTFPELKNIASAIAAKSAVLDGEIVSIDKKGVSHFVDLRAGRQENLFYVVFDLLYVDGYSLLNVPLQTRKELLRALLVPHEFVRYTDHIEAAGEKYYEVAGVQGLEGIVAKERNSRYEPGQRTHTWYKIKHRLEQEFVVGGWLAGQGTREKTIGSLLIGVYQDDKLVPVGRVGSGFAEKNLVPLLAALRKLHRSTSPFAKKFPLEQFANFVEPRLVAQVKFAEWTPGGGLRQPVFVGLRSDKPAREIMREKPRPALELSSAVRTRPARTTSTRPQTAKSGDKSVTATAKLNPSLPLTTDKNQEITMAGATLKLTNLDKPFWRRPNIKKRDVINYYNRLAPVLLPHLKDRPLSLKRYPEGASEWFFYQKEAPSPRPRFVQTTSVIHSHGPTRYVMVNNVQTLIWLTNLADLEIHPWYSRHGSLNHPDYVVFDLDPTPEDDLGNVRAVALLIEDVLEHLGLTGYAKSSGSRGIHIYVPIAPKFTYEQTKLFAKKVTEIVHQLAPKQTTLEFRKAKRHGVYIDYLQNIKGKTLACVYSLRARPGAAVATPLSWREVKKGFEISDFNYQTIFERLKKYGDLFAPTLTHKQNLGPALAAVRKF